MKHPNPIDRDNAILWAKNVLSKKQNYVIIDTESSGAPNDIAIQIGIIDLDGNTLFDSLINSDELSEINPKAQVVHAIDMNQLKKAPLFEDVYQKLKQIIESRVLLIYNKTADVRFLNNLCIFNKHPSFKMNTECIMKQYAKLTGYLQKGAITRYRDIPLLKGNHTAVEDCKAALSVLHDIANGIPCALSLKDLDNLRKERINQLFSHKKIDSNLKRPNLDIEDKSHLFYDKKVVITGTFESFTKRNDMAALIHAVGGDVNSRISSKTDFVILGKGAGPVKQEKVKALGIKTLNESEFLKLFPKH